MRLTSALRSRPPRACARGGCDLDELARRAHYGVHERRQGRAHRRHEASRRVHDVQLARALEVLKSWTYFEKLRKKASPTSVQARAAESAL